MEHAFTHVVKNAQLSLFRGRLLRAAGLTLIAAPTFIACTNEVTVFDGGGGAGTGGTTSSGSTSSNGATSGSTNGSTSGSTSGSTTTSASSGVTSSSTGMGGAMTSSSTGMGGTYPVEVTCFPTDVQAPCPDVGSAASMFGECTYESFNYITEWLDGPLPSEPGFCCYEVVTEFGCGVGRPYATEAGAVVAKARTRSDWSAAHADSDIDLSVEQRRALARAWTRDGLFEHASVASFSRFALELMSVGAPPELVEDAHRAALDEIEHARLCFALATRFGGQPVGPDALPLSGDGAVRTELAAIAAATAAEGCIGETLAASLAAAQRDAATDPQVRATLDKIAEDEARHAELAWRTVAWALKQGDPQVHDAVTKVFANARAHMIPAASDVAVPSCGLLDAREQATLQMRVLTEVIGPCAQSLLS